MSSQNPARILLVEDQPVASKAALKIIERCHYAVDAAEDGKKALALCRQNKYFLIFMDLILPDVDGLTLTETIRKTDANNAETPIIALTALGDNASQNQASWVGMDDFIVKPITIEKCQQLIETFARGRKLRKGR